MKTTVPIFPGYVFVQLESAEKTLLLNSHKIVRILPVTELTEKQLVAELKEIRKLQKARLESPLSVLPELTPGKSVSIVSGPLAGVNGIVEWRGKKAKVTINVDMLGQSVSTELSIEQVEINPSAP